MCSRDKGWPQVSQHWHLSLGGDDLKMGKLPTSWENGNTDLVEASCSDEMVHRCIIRRIGVCSLRFGELQVQPGPAYF